MKKIGFLIFILALIVGVGLSNMFSFGKLTGRIFNFSFNSGVVGSGSRASEKREVSDFSGINVGGVFQVEATAGKDFSVEIEADDNLLALIKTEVRGNTLRLETKEKISSKNPIIVRLTAPNLENIDVSSASKVSLSNVSNENLIIDASGASKITVSGESANLVINASGASKIAAESLRAESAAVDASGASNVEIFAVKELKTDVSGASNVIYQGNPTNLIKKTSGASSVRQK